MSLEVAFYVKDTKQKGSVALVSKGHTPHQAVIKMLKSVRATGYPMRNTITSLVRELLYLKLENDLYGEKSKLRSKHGRGSFTSMDFSKKADGA